MFDRRIMGPWIVCLALSAALTLALAMHPEHAHPVGARIGRGILVWIALAAAFRFVAWLVERSRG